MKIKFDEKKTVAEFKALAVEQLVKTGVNFYLTDFIIDEKFSFKGGHIVSSKKDSPLSKFYIIKKYKLDWYSDDEFRLIIQTANKNYEYWFETLA